MKNVPINFIPSKWSIQLKTNSPLSNNRFSSSFRNKIEDSHSKCRWEKVKMKLLQFVQRSYALLGIASDQLKRKYRFNSSILLVSFSYSASSISQLIFLSRVINSASSFTEYSECVFVFAANILTDICYAISVFNTPKLFSFIGNCEELVRESE